MKIIRIYTDGGCRGNQSSTNIGGYGAVLEYGKNVKTIKGGGKNTTNNVMEMTALLEALRALKKDGQIIEVFSDSAYLTDCFRQKWYVRWQKNGWKTAKKEPVENREIWEDLLSYLDRHDISFYRVKGHVNTNDPQAMKKQYAKFKEWNGDGFDYDDFVHIYEMNNECDRLANIAMDELK